MPIMLLTAVTWTEKEPVTDLHLPATQKQSLGLLLLSPGWLNTLTGCSSFGEQIPEVGDESTKHPHTFNMQTDSCFLGSD